MCPSLAVLAGGGDGGGGSGNGAGDGDGSADGSGNGDGADASGDGKNGGEGCGDPVCPITGRVFLDIYDFGFAGPLPLRWMRHYSSRRSKHHGELGFGWSHDFGWTARERRATVQIFDDAGRQQVFDKPPHGGSPVSHPLGYRLWRSDGGFMLVDRDGMRRVFGPEASDGLHHLVEVVDRNGNRTTVNRDPIGRLLSMVDSAGRSYRVSTDGAGRIERVMIATAPDASTWMEVVRYQYDENGDLTSATDAEGYAARYEYDGHLLTAHHSVSGPTYRWRYDGTASDARCLETWGDELGVMPAAVLADKSATGTAKGIYYQRFTYGPNRYTEVEDGLGGCRRFFGDPAGRVVKEVTASGGVVEREFDPSTGRTSRETTADGVQTSVQSNGARPIGFTTNAGDAIQGKVDEEGYFVSIYEKKDAAPAIVRRKFDERGNLRVLIHHDGSRDSFDVDERGLVVRHFNRMGALTAYTHDAQGNCTRAVGPGGQTETMEYDYLGRRTRHVDPDGNETRWSWDRRSEVVQKDVAGLCTYRFQYNGARKIIAVDEHGRVTRFSYGGQDWLIQVEQPGMPATQYRYDVQGRLRTVTNGRGQTYSARYDHGGRCISWTTFEGVQYSATFDGMDRVTSIRDPLGRVVWSYDDDSRLEGLEFRDGTSITFSYDGRGGPAKTGGTLVPAERIQDAFGRVVGEKLGAHALHVDWNQGVPMGLEADVGSPIRFGYDEHGELKSVRVGRHERIVNRRNRGDLVSYLGDKLVLRQRLGPAGELLSQTLGRRLPGLTEDELALPDNPGTLFSAEYSYDASLNLVGERRGDGRSVRNELSPSGQVTRRTLTNARGELELDEQIGYDGAGSPRMTSTAYDAAGRPTEHRGERLEYDALGRLVRRGTDLGLWTYTWNGLDQLVKVTAPDREIQLDYDARHRLARKRVFRQRELVKKVSYVWNNNVLLHEVDELTGSTRTYDRIDGSWLVHGHVDVHGDSEARVHYLLDPTGCPQLGIDDEGNVVFRAERSTYGQLTVTDQKARIASRLANQLYDEDLDLTYTWHRWFDARVGLFISTDPLFLEGNDNPRDYAPNPFNLLHGQDPTGWVVPPAAVALAQPGPNAVGPGGRGSSTVPGCIPCPPNMYERDGKPGKSAQDAIDAAGNKYGCHSCKKKKAGTDSGHWIGDHQPPLSTYPNGEPPAGANVWLYPHCSSCASQQGGFMSHHAEDIGRTPAHRGNRRVGATRAAR
jgi:RHS repeat-associated protein